MKLAKYFAGALSGIALAGASLPAMAADYELRFAEFGSSRGPRAEALQWWGDEVNKRSDGRIVVEFFWAQSLAKGPDTVQAIGSGLADVGSAAGTYIPAEMPVWSLANQPFAIDDMWVGMRVWTELQETLPALQEEMKRHNIKLLANYSSGNVHLLSKDKPIRSLEDLQGLKVRTTSGISPVLEALGAVPVALNIPETYQAMERGTVDATINYTPFIKAYKHYEVGKYLTEVGFGQTMGYGLAINRDLFDEMPEDLQQIIEEVSADFVDHYAKLYLTAEEEAREQMMAGIDGYTVEIIQLSPEERERWKAPAIDTLEEWKAEVASKGVDPEPILAAMLAAKRKYESELEAQGYPWRR